MGEINVKRLGRAHAETHKRVLPLAVTVSLGAICFILGISLIAWAPSTRSKPLVQTKQQQSSGRTNGPDAGRIGVENDSNTNGAYYALGGLFLILAFVFGVVGTLVSPWRLQIRQRGLVYQSIMKTYATSWSEITDLRVHLSKRPILYYHIQARTLKKKGDLLAERSGRSGID